MERRYNKRLKTNAQNLRRNMTKEERHLWYDFLKQLPITVHRQKVIGYYIVDFYIAEAKLVIELDGSQHFDAEQLQKDRERTACLEHYGLRVIRIPNNLVSENFRGVCEYLEQFLNQAGGFYEH